MELDEKKMEESAEAFGKDFLDKIKPYPFGSIPKRDMDCLIFFLLEKHGLVPGRTNRDKAYSLNISETKLKSYMVDANARHGKREQDASIERVFDALRSGNGVSVEGDTLVFFEENPVVRADFVQGMKDMGFYTDSSFNNEIIKVKAASFLAFAIKKGSLSDSEILDVLNKGRTDGEKITDFKNANKSLKDVLQDSLDILKSHDKPGLPAIIELFSYATDIVNARSNKATA